jgi:hypothetical protein
MEELTELSHGSWDAAGKGVVVYLVQNLYLQRLME